VNSVSETARRWRFDDPALLRDKLVKIAFTIGGFGALLD
jgi:hypothetical protein